MSLIDLTLDTGYREWMEEAFCLQFPADWWHSDDQADTWQARKLCKGCPVIQECLRHALDNEETEGVWGGTTPSERRKILAGKPAHRSCEKNHPGEPRDERWSMSDGRGYADCRACERVTTARRRERNRAKVAEANGAAA